MNFARLLAAALCLLPASATLAQDVFSNGVTISDNNLSSADLFVTSESVLDGDVCIGNGCAVDEAFDSETLLKLDDTVVGILFEDSSTSTFPDRNWRLVVNDAANISSGGLERFSIHDDTAGTTPFTILGTAPENSFWMDANGLLGLGTSVPQADLHVIASSGAPTLRLESSVGGSAVWQIFGSDPLRFRNMTNATTPFSIQAIAPEDSLYIDTSGNVGFGTDNPEELLHIRSNAFNTDAFALFDAAGSGSDAAFLLRQNGVVPTTWEFRNQESSGRLNVGVVGGNKPFKIDGSANTNLLRLGLSGEPDVVSITGELRVNNTQLNVPDYVFSDDYALRPLADVRSFIHSNSHLPEVPSAADVARDGVDMTEMQMVLLKKVEELTLYTLEQDNLIKEMAARLAVLEAE